jgi:hypothetical protein
MEAKIPGGRRGPILARSLSYSSSPRTARGPLDQAFRRGLFAVPYGQGYYAGYTDREGVLAVAEPDWEVRVWRRVDGEMVEVTRVTGKDGDEAEVEVDVHEGTTAPMSTSEEEKPEGPEDETEALEDVDWEAEDDDWEWPGHAWGAMSVGTEFTPLVPEGRIQLTPSRVTADQFAGFAQSGAGQALRGFDVRWWGFAAKNPRQYPRAEGYFRSGYTQGIADFLPATQNAGQFLVGEPTRLQYFTVPMFLGGNLYAFRKIPVRPFAGAGFGIDVLSLTFDRHNRQRMRDVSGRIGFELHAGIDIRFTNWVGIVGEIRQLWSARRRLDHVPNFANEGFTVVTSLKFGFPLRPKRKRGEPSSKPAEKPSPGKPANTPPEDVEPAPIAPSSQEPASDSAAPTEGDGDQGTEGAMPGFVPIPPADGN